jgi:hypothetical protein
MQKGDLAGARRHLEAVARQRPFALPELSIYLHALAVLGLLEGTWNTRASAPKVAWNWASQMKRSALYCGK